MQILNLLNEAASAYCEEQYKCIDSITEEESATRKYSQCLDALNINGYIRKYNKITG